MSLVFKEYTSILEIRFDLENAEQQDNKQRAPIINFYFMFSNTSVSKELIKPLCFIFTINDQKTTFDIKSINETFGYVPSIILQKIAIDTDTVKKICKQNKYGFIKISKSLKNMIIVRDRKEEYDKHEKNFVQYCKQTSIPKVIGNDFNTEISLLSSFFGDNLKVENGFLVITWKSHKGHVTSIRVSNNASLCESLANMQTDTIDDTVNIEMSDLVLFNYKTIPEATILGNFYIYGYEQTYPVNENIAIIEKCSKCGTFYIKNWFKQRSKCC